MDGYTPFTFYPATYASGQHGRTKENSPEDTALPQLPNSSYPYGAYTSTYQQPVVQPQSPLLASSYHAQQPGHRLSDRVLDDPAAVTTNPGVMDMSYAYGQGPNSGGTAEDYSPAYSDDADANADDFDSDSHLGASSESKPTLPATARKSVTSAATGPASESKAGDLKKKRVVKSRGTAPAGVVITEKSCLRCRVRKVKCDRMFPCCNNCKVRNEDCDLITLHPNDARSSTERDRADSERLSRLEARLAELETSLSHSAAEGESASMRIDRVATPGDRQTTTKRISESSSTAHVTSNTEIGQRSVDWRLATPQMAKSLSQHLCDAFFESCCFVLPTFSYYRARLPEYRDLTDIDASTKVAIAAFCAVGARASPHSALLGIEASPDDARDHPAAPLLSAGTRRQSACHVLLAQAHTLCFEEGLMDDATVDNLAAVLALMQMTTFVELQPKKSRSLLRAALGHYKELQDAAKSAAEAETIQKTFGYAVYTSDCLNSAYARRSCLITDADLTIYFSKAGIALPNLPDEELLPVLRALLVNPANGDTEAALRTALHLVSCWTAACQRLLAKMAAPCERSIVATRQAFTTMFRAIDRTRAGIHLVQRLTDGLTPHSHSLPHGGSPSSSSRSHAHEHETDYLARVVRLDRDLLDLFSLARTIAQHLPYPASATADIQEACLSRVRKALKCEAFYVKYYAQGADAHMVFHVAVQLDLTPDWTQLAVQKLGEPNGPKSADEALTQEELDWLTEAMQIACYYTPHAERRLQELSPRFVSMETAPLPDKPFPRCVKIGDDGGDSPEHEEAQDGSAGLLANFGLENFAPADVEGMYATPTSSASQMLNQHNLFLNANSGDVGFASLLQPRSSHYGQNYNPEWA